MRKILLSLVCIVAGSIIAEAQQVPDGYVLADSLVYIPSAGVDTTLTGRNVFDLLSSTVSQSPEVRAGFERHVEGNSTKRLTGFRVRIFFDNKQDARVSSETAVSRFRELFPGVSVYRSYTAPFFKVTVGDCRTRSEAMQLLQRVKYEYPTAFVVKENITYPPVDKDHAYIVDTIKVLRPIE